MLGPVYLDDDAVELRTIEVAAIGFLQSTVDDPRVRTSLPPSGR